jgi:hypothetical protein
VSINPRNAAKWVSSHSLFVVPTSFPSKQNHPRFVKPSDPSTISFHHLLNFDKEKPRSRMPLGIEQIHKSVALLQTIEPYASPRGQLVHSILRIFDFESRKQVSRMIL